MDAFGLCEGERAGQVEEREDYPREQNVSQALYIDLAAHAYPLMARASAIVA